jgi:hypothetical protein
MAKKLVREVRALVRERELEDDAAELQSEANYARSTRIVLRALSDATHGFRLCPLRACRRARRCVNEACLCLTLRPKPVLPAGYQDFLIEDVLETLQARRKKIARAGQRQ